MGRARVPLKAIPNKRSRRTTFMQRKKGLIKKISEFSTMCRVEACLIVYDDGNGDFGPVTWPEDPALVRSIIENYDRQRIERPSKTFDIQDFFENRKNMIEVEISKLHKQAREIKYPTWDPSLSNMGEEQLRAFLTNVNAKILACVQRIDMLKNVQQDEVNTSLMAEGSASSSHQTQPNSTHNISQSLIIPTPFESLLDDNNGRVNFTNAANQFVGGSNDEVSMLRNMQQGGACFWYMPNMVQEKATSSQPSQLITLQGKNDMVHFSNQVYVPQYSTNQLGESMDWSNHLREWANGPIGTEDWSSLLNSDLVGWASQPDGSILQNISTPSQNEQQGVALPALPPSIDRYQTDYNNMPFPM